ncbi:hypothetical protein IVA96_05450 [Bradyrhizobium sp. 159]|uniref:hypothetical protein n=1 Tax=Bradyrhizobium sp. 159 TaxID=2782632 RepID=UPI001FF9016A|nr:hypothetical protein [Bradyrhizobium sp. 159]MCK1616116.1 hypothetical protein [Bradyrhizobium sp. 159]
MLRGVLLLLGAGGMLWSLAVLPSFWLTTPARAIAARIMEDQRFRPGALSDALSRITNDFAPFIVQPELLHAEALIRLQKAEEAIQRKSPDEADREVEKAENKLRASLSTSPNDSFLWLLLHSIEMTRNGFDTDHSSYLMQSYMIGPYEGWISLRRNRLALAALPMLGGTTQERVVAEFASLVDSDFIEDASLNLTTVGWVHRERLAASLAGTDIVARESFAKRLSKDGVKIKIPGIETQDRPWK